VIVVNVRLKYVYTIELICKHLLWQNKHQNHELQNHIENRERCCTSL